MQIEQIMSRPVQCCSPQDTLAHAAELMWTHDCGCIPVCSADGDARVVGIVTDRDICMHALFRGKPLHDLMVADVMTGDLQVCRPGDSLADAEQTMRHAKLRRLPVLDESDALVGIVSLADLAQEAARQHGAVFEEVSETEVADTLATICAPEHHHLAA